MVKKPKGWHVPTDSEWNAFINYLDPNAAGGSNHINTAGGKMKSMGTQYWQSPNQDATNESGFSGLPGGDCNFSGAFTTIVEYGYWWSSTEYDTYVAWSRTLYYGNGDVYRNGDYGKSDGFSVRCLRD
jgi:uncharacterized protein (TIGR02145 family)